MKPTTPRAPASAIVARLVGRVARRRAACSGAERRLDARAGLRAAARVRSRAIACVSPVPNGMVSMKRTCQGRVERERRERHDVVLVEAADDDGVQLDGREARRLGGLDAGPDVGQRAPAHDARHALRIEAVEVDVDPAQAGRLQLASASRGRRMALVVIARSPHAGNAREPGDDLDQVGAQGRLAAGQAELAEADGDRCAAHLLDLGGGQQVAGPAGSAGPCSGMQ